MWEQRRAIALFPQMGIFSIREAKWGTIFVADHEHLALIKQGVEQWNSWRENNPVNPDLSSANLSEVYLFEARLERVNLRGANLSEACLIGANLSHADLSGANLNRAYLNDANLSGANLSEANLNYANLIGANLSKAHLVKTGAIATNFAAAQLTGACLVDWQINSVTQLGGVECHYIYIDRQRHPQVGDFEPGEFTKLFQSDDKPPESEDLFSEIFAFVEINESNALSWTDAIPSPAAPPSAPTSPAKALASRLLLWCLTGISMTLALGVGVYAFRRIQMPQIASEQTAMASTVAFSPDGQFFASSRNEQIRLWSLDSKMSRTLSGHTGAVRAIAFSADGQILVSGGDDKTIKIWHAQTGQLLRTLTGHTATISSVAISADQQTVVSSSTDGTIKVWQLQTGQLNTFSEHSELERTKLHPLTRNPV